MSTETTGELQETKKVWGIGWHWWILITAAIQNVCDGATGEMYPMFSAMLIAPVEEGGCGWTALAIKAPRALTSWLGYCTLFTTALLYERYFMKYRRGLQIMIIIGICGMFIGPSLYPLYAHHRYWMLWVIPSCTMWITSLQGYALTILISNWFHERKGLAMGLSGITAEGGDAIIWGSLGGWLMDGLKIPWRWVAFIGGWSLLPAFPAHIKFSRTFPSDIGVLPYGVKKEDAVDAEAAREARRRGERVLSAQENWGFTLTEAFKHWSFWVMFACIIIAPTVWSVSSAGRGIFGKYVMGLSMQQIGNAVTIYGIWYSIQGTILGWVCDYTGWDKRMAVAWAMIGGGVFNGTMWILCMKTMSLPVYYIACVGVAAGVAAWVPMIAASAAERYGPLAMGLVYTFYGRLPTSIAGTVGSLWAGWMWDRYHSFETAYWALIIGGFILFWLVLFAKRPSRKMYETIKRPPWWAVANEPAPWEARQASRKAGRAG